MNMEEELLNQLNHNASPSVSIEKEESLQIFIVKATMWNLDGI